MNKIIQFFKWALFSLLGMSLIVVILAVGGVKSPFSDNEITNQKGQRVRIRSAWQH